MDILRKYIRQAILESSLKPFPFYSRKSKKPPSKEELKDAEILNVDPSQWNKDQKMAWGILNIKPGNIKRFNGEGGRGSWADYDRWSASRDEQTVPFDEEFATVDQKHMQWAQFLRVTLRRLWEDRVINSIERNSWWNKEDLENHNVRCFHHPQLFQKGRHTQEGIDKFEEYIQRSLTGSMPDLSAEGLLRPSPAYILRGSISIELKKRKIVWAGLNDQWTEFLSLASADIISKNPEGIRKHPNTRVDPNDILFDPSQIIEGTKTIAEIVLTDWDLNPDHIIIYYSKYGKNRPDDIVEQLENLGIKYFNKPYKVIECL